MDYNLWQAEPEGALVSDAGEFRLVVKLVNGWVRYLVLRRGAGGSRGQALLASGTEDSAPAAMAAAERTAERLAGVLG
jgi:hypothetical protein